MFLKRRSLLCSALLLVITCSQFATAQEGNWRRYNQAGAEAYQTGSYGQSERMFRQAIKEAEKFGGGRDLRLATSLTNLGVLYNSRGHAAKAAPLFERAVAIKLAALGPDNFEVVTSTAKLCQFYACHAQPRADRYAERVLNHAQKAIRSYQQMRANFAALANFYQSHRELEEADILVRQAQDITQKQVADQYLELAVLLDGLGNVYGDRPQAEQFFKLALAIREQSLTGNHIALASSSESLAMRYVSDGKLTQAEPLLRRAYEISNRTLGAGRPETLRDLEALAQCELKLGKAAEAESLYREGLALCQKAHGSGSEYTAKMQVALGSLLSRSARYQEASSLLAQALKTSEQLNGPQHASLSPLLDAYADVLDKTNRKAEAKKLHARAKGIRG